MGAIWRAEHLVLCAPVAVKLIDPEIADHEETLARFNREAQAAASLRSPHVVQILDYGVDDDTPFMVMELLEGETLAERLKRVERLSPAETARFITHVARAVNRAHDAGITHRDLKPENVFIVHNEDAEIAKVLDFGVAKVEKATLGPKGQKTRTGSLLGTPYYMSPEQAQGNKDVDYRSDLWALGVIAFECMTGKRPFESEGLGDLVLQICVRDLPVPSTLAPMPPEFDEWFVHACSRDPEGRFASAREMAEALRTALGETRATVVTIDEEDRPPSSSMQRAAKAAAGDDAESASGGDKNGKSGDEAGQDKAEPLSRALTKRDPGVAEEVARVEAAARAETIAAPPSFRPSALDAKARGDAPGEARAPAEESGSRAGVVLAVAGGALLLGLVGGFVVMGQHHDTSQRPLPDVGADAGASSAVVTDEAGARHLAHSAALHQHAHDASADAHADAFSAATEAGTEAGVREAGAVEAGAKSTDAGAKRRASDAGQLRVRDAAAVAPRPAPAASAKKPAAAASGARSPAPPKP